MPQSHISRRGQAHARGLLIESGPRHGPRCLVRFVPSTSGSGRARGKRVALVAVRGN